MNDTSIKTELLAEVRREWANFERLCASLSEAEMVTPGVEADWSVKDILCHLCAWEKYLLDRLGMLMTGQPPRYAVMTNWEDVHRFNAQVYTENKDRPLNTVILEFRSLYGGVLSVLEALNESQLAQAYTYDFPEDNIILVQLIRANTYEHYQEHRNAIEKWRQI